MATAGLALSAKARCEIAEVVGMVVDHAFLTSDHFDPLIEESRRVCFQLEKEVVVTPHSYGAEIYFHLALPESSKFFRIGYREYVFLSLLDGGTTLAHALAEASQALGKDALSEAESKQLVDWLLEQGVIRKVAIAGEQTNSPKVVTSTDRASNPSWIRNLNPFWMKFPLNRILGQPDRLLDVLMPAFRWCFHPVTILAMLVVLFLAALTVGTHYDELFRESNRIFLPSNWLFLIGTWFGLKVVHELAHALCCRYHGGKVQEAGLIFILMAPMAYVDVTSSWQFQSRWRRMSVAVAGMFVELFLASIALLAWFQVESVEWKQMLLNVIFGASISTLLFNANPLMKFDGYFLVSDLLKIPNLYASGMDSVKDTAKWLMFGEQRMGGCVELRNRATVVRVYGWLATVWKVVVCVGLTLTASSLLGGWGILLAAFGVFGWIGKPLWAAAKDLAIRWRVAPQQAFRASLVMTSLLAMSVGFWYGVPNPFPVQAPCVVDYLESAKVRSGASGFIVDICVEDGTEVNAGDVLIKLENRELDSQIKQLNADLERFMIEERIAIDKHDASAAQIAIQDQRSAEKQLEQLLLEQAQLCVVAPADGTLVAPKLNAMIGTYVESGKLLFSIDSSTSKEVLLSIAAADAMALTEQRDQNLFVYLGDRRPVRARIERVNPRVSDQLPHPALSASNGGVLAVKGPDEASEEPRMVEPRFVARALLNPSTSGRVRVGETGVAMIGHSKLSLGQSLWLAGRNWIRKQWEDHQTLNKDG